VAPLRVPGAGTEVVAPLLALLVELARPQRVLEVGMGYTTPFLAAALESVRRQVAAEGAALAAKTHRCQGELDDDWLYAEPALAAPGYHLGEYAPSLVAVDNLSLADSSAAGVRTVLATLGLDDLVTVVNRDLTEAATALPATFHPIDFAWVDAWECLYFFDHYWDLINPDGGLVAMHYLLTYPEGEAVLRYLRKFQQANPGELEVVSLLEPHKLMQNSITLLRRTSGLAHRGDLGAAGHVRYGAELTAAARQQAGLPVPEPDMSAAERVEAGRA
jgi:predicted O-methyltransferase YrrM